MMSTLSTVVISGLSIEAGPPAGAAPALSDGDGGCSTITQLPGVMSGYTASRQSTAGCSCSSQSLGGVASALGVVVVAELVMGIGAVAPKGAAVMRRCCTLRSGDGPPTCFADPAS